GEDHRGESRYEKDLKGWPDAHARDHFSLFPDGMWLKTPLELPWTRCFSVIHDPEDDDLDPGLESPDTGSGGVELWVSLARAQGDVCFFSIMEGATTNRV